MANVYLVRHALAADRGRWRGPDDHRPLTELGWRQAVALVGRLRDTRAFVTSPTVRCSDTLLPAAHALGLPVIGDERLREGREPQTWEEAAALLDALSADHLSGGEGALAICSHGDVLPALLPPGDHVRTCPKGGVWLVPCASPVPKPAYLGRLDPEALTWQTT